MNAVLGRTATRIHFLLVLVVATAGIGLLAAIAGVMLLTEDHYSRDMGLLGLMVTSPLWLAGLAAGMDALLVLRRGAVSRLRALVWAVLLVGAGTFVGVTGGSLSALAMLVGEPGSVHLDWPALAVPIGDGGVQYFYLDSPMLWLPIVGILVGAASLLAQLRDRRARRLTA